MKIAIIGANGNLGKRVVKQALDRNIEVKGFIYDGDLPDSRVTTIKKSLFDIRKEDISDCDAVISAYGSGFKADPALNHKAFLKYMDLCRKTDKHLIAIGGAGSLYTDAKHQILCYESPEHPDFLREISKNIKLGIDELKAIKDMNWTVVCPSSFFDPDGGFTGNYQVGTAGHLIVNKEGKSYVTYDDMAKAMVDIAVENTYNQMQITVLTV